MHLSIRPCLERDLTILDRTFVVAGGHRPRLHRQLQGEATYLTAWTGEVIVGHVLVSWDGSRHEHVRQEYPGVPEICRLMVTREQRRNGVARRLLLAAEAHAMLRGHDLTGLAVAVDNLAARRLYYSVGYVDSALPNFQSPFGVGADGMPKRHVVSYMTKSLDASVLT